MKLKSLEGSLFFFGQLLEIYYREENHRLGVTAEVLSCYMS